jgi:uncharacterized protein YrrD
MQKYFSEIIGSEIFASEEKKVIGNIRDLIIDPKNGRLLALVCQRGNWFRKTLIIAAGDISEFGKQIQITSAKKIIPIGKLPLENKIWEQKIRIVGSAVKTEEKKFIGIALDYAIETTTFFMVKLVVGPSLVAPMAKKRIIPFEAILSIKRDEITIAEDEFFQGVTAARPA